VSRRGRLWRKPSPLSRWLSKLVPAGGHCTHFKAGQTSSFHLGRSMSPRRAGWILIKGREPKGTLRARCGTTGCMTVGHLVDDWQERGARNPDIKWSRLHPSGEGHAAQLRGMDFIRGIPGLREIPCLMCGGPTFSGACHVTECGGSNHELED
jgi:hypothetical protein